MACRGCSSDGCNCSVTGDGVAISVTGSGTPVTDPYVVSFGIEGALGDVTVDDATDCTLLDDPHIPVLLGDGSTIMVPLPCYTALDEPVPGNAFPFSWDSGTAATDPGAGYIKFDSATYSSVTEIFVSANEFNGTSVADWLDSFDAGMGDPLGAIRVYSRTDSTVWATFILTSTYDPAAGWRALSVTYYDHAGAFSDVVLGDIVLDFAPSGAGATGGFNSIQTIRSVTGADNVVLADVGKYLRCANASPFSLTVPDNATVTIPVGAHIDIIQSGAGQVTIAAAGGVTINATPGLKLNGQWAGATLVKVGTDEWDLVGNLSA